MPRTGKGKSNKSNKGSPLRFGSKNWQPWLVAQMKRFEYFAKFQVLCVESSPFGVLCRYFCYFCLFQCAAFSRQNPKGPPFGLGQKIGDSGLNKAFWVPCTYSRYLGYVNLWMQVDTSVTLAAWCSFLITVLHSSALMVKGLSIYYFVYNWTMC